MKAVVVVPLPAVPPLALMTTSTPAPPHCKVKALRAGALLSYPDASPRRFPALGAAAVCFVMAGGALALLGHDSWVPFVTLGSIFGIIGLFALKRSPKTLALFHDVVTDHVTRRDFRIVRALAEGPVLRGVLEDGSQITIRSDVSTEQARWMAEQLNASLARELK